MCINRVVVNRTLLLLLLLVLLMSLAVLSRLLLLLLALLLLLLLLCLVLLVLSDVRLSYSIFDKLLSYYYHCRNTYEIIVGSNRICLHDQ